MKRGESCTHGSADEACRVIDKSMLPEKPVRSGRSFQYYCERIIFQKIIPSNPIKIIFISTEDFPGSSGNKPVIEEACNLLTCFSVYSNENHA